MFSIRNKLLLIFMVVIILMTAGSAGYIVMHFNIVRQYRNVTDNMVLESSIIECITEFIQDYNALAQDITNEDKTRHYNNTRDKIEDIFSYLDQTIVYGPSRVVYRGVKNIWKSIERSCNDGIQDVLNGNIVKVSGYYEEANMKNYYLANTLRAFISEELNFAKKLQHSILYKHRLALTIVSILFIFIFLSSIVISLIFANRITVPLVDLSVLSDGIAKGNQVLKVKKDLIQRNDEIGILARAFDVMVENLRKNIKELKESQDLLIHAEKMEAIGRIASGVAHEVRNPIGIVLQAINYLEAQKVKNQVPEPDTLEMMKNNIKRADNIIKALVDFSRRAELKSEPQDINPILESSLGLIQHKLKLEHIELVKDLKDGLPKVLVDRQKMEQVFVNLLLNACQAMPNGGKIFIRSYQKEFRAIGGKVGYRIKDSFRPQEKVVVVEIEDTGIGVSPGDLDKIFEPFFTTKRDDKGTGLGLYVTKNIIERHKGSIEVESKKDKGAKFILNFKIERA